jgi:tRNA threonylcarbamoyladenosine biosynthesis protein TsaE
MQKLSGSVNQTLAIGRSLARNLCGGEIILLSGPLGVGKTVFAKGIAQGLGINKNNIISPTFVLLRIHKGRHRLQHFDFYRVNSPQDIFALDYQEYFYSDAVTIIEWPERLKFLLPQEFLRIKLFFKGKNKRLLNFTARGLKHKKLLEKIHEDTRD